MNTIVQIITYFALMAIMTVASCSVGQLAGGNSSQTGNNGIIVSVAARTVSGTTRPGAQVFVYDQDYRAYRTPAGFCDSTTANDSGQYVFPPLPAGYVNLLVKDDGRGESAFVPHIPAFNDSTFSDTVAALKRPGFLSGVATDSLGRTFALSYVYIAGSPFYAVTRNDGSFTLGPLTAGSYFIGMVANFQTTEFKGGLASLSVESTDKSATTIYPDSISIWGR